MKYFKIVCFFFSLFAVNANAQLPVILGAVLETGSGLLESGNYGTGIVRITPFAGAWVNGIGFVRLGVSSDAQKETDSLGESHEMKRLDFSIQVGVSALGPEYPYIALSYVNAGFYSQNGDLEWKELGLGFGHRFSFSSRAAVVIEAEHRWIVEHSDKQRYLQVSGRRMQINFGLVANPL